MIVKFASKCRYFSRIIIIRIHLNRIHFQYYGFYLWRKYCSRWNQGQIYQGNMYNLLIVFYGCKRFTVVNYYKISYHWIEIFEGSTSMTHDWIIGIFALYKLIRKTLLFHRTWQSFIVKRSLRITQRYEHENQKYLPSRSKVSYYVNLVIYCITY